jgi:death-on-curing protein
MSPLILTLDEVLAIHENQIARYGGAPGIRDMGLLMSALSQPVATFGGRFLHADVYEMAAAYLFHIVRNHPFADGNKRVGTVAALVFLALNDVDVKAPGDDLELLVLGVAQGRTDKPAITAFLRDHAS